MGSSSRREERYEEMAEGGGERSDRDEGGSTTEAEEGSSGDGDADADADGFVVRCLRALDLQVVGACRADERLTPLLKLNASAGIGRGPAEDRLIAQLIQHFEVSEIGLLARCLCVPLVSIRVGKIDKQGSLLCPTADRGHLNLNILPSSHLRLSLLSDDGQSQTLNPLSADLSDDVIVRQIPSDPSARSFSLQLPHSHQSHYFWLSERSLLHGTHLLDKMKDVLKTKPTLSSLTGISNSRLDSFGAHIQAYLIWESKSGISKSGISNPSFSSPLIIPRPPKIRHSKNPNLRSRSYISFKDNSFSSSSLAFRTLSPREKSRKRNNNNNEISFNFGPLVIPSLPIVSSPFPIPTIPTSQSERDTSSSDPFALPPDLIPQFSPFNPLTFNFPIPPPDINKENPKFKPHYCWCPIASSPVVPSSPLQSISLPLQSIPPPVPSLSSPVGIPPLPAFSGLMSDPIVHLPLMDFSRSSGQLAYLVSSGPVISPAGVPVQLATESLVEKNARETLRRLLEGESRCMADRVHSGPFGIKGVMTGLTVDRVHGGPFGLGSVMSGISSIGFCASLEGGESSGSEEEEETRNEENDD